MSMIYGINEHVAHVEFSTAYGTLAVNMINNLDQGEQACPGK